MTNSKRPGIPHEVLAVEPAAGRIIVLPDERPDEVERDSGLIVMQVGDNPATSGRVVATPHNYQDGFSDPLYAVGDHVLFSPWAGFTLGLNGVEYKMMAEDEILGRLLPEATDVEVK